MESIEFTIHYLGWKGDRIASDTVRRRDLTAAVKLAGGRLARGDGKAADAHGVFVERKR
jgi:hypothetical protein